ncbi:hypothetical protein BGW36DRAFT_377794 [Talaromyces proteolyticus]|uniref:DUF7730 domain-containing protein n=1 Tax=Talaromyces proteolyticus TaxID=1131652 RepID=A0AAD4KUG3_9EURO|nr:uncharacterized protein BGW36DRAFT_377794 [Talaromyces proteolyticus]KAH8697026.1 hypothetical protein BGW36DRAFT_377794 [Talaromyces proteolyticus]
MRHFDAWILRDPYSIFHYYSTGRRWQESVRGMIQERQICSPQIDPTNTRSAVDALAFSISSQPESNFLQRLPPEIRVMIYKYVFGDEAVHLVQLKGKIRHVRCSNLSSSISSHRTCCHETSARWRATATGAGQHADNMLYPHTHSLLPHKLSNSSLSLLRTCRAIYLEAADIPYTDLVFDVDDLHTFVAFSQTVCPERLQSIKRLTVQWTPIWQPLAGEDSKTSIYAHTHNDRLWCLFWARVQALTGLKELRISLDLGRFMGNANANANVLLGGNKKISLATSEKWVTPMLSVRGLKEFDLCVTAKCDASAKNILAEEIGRDAMALCAYLREVMCKPREAVMPCALEGVENPACRPAQLLLTAA